jgi:hypothetical protein
MVTWRTSERDGDQKNSGASREKSRGTIVRNKIIPIRILEKYQAF